MMNEMILGIVGYMAGDIITLILGRFGLINLAPVAKVLVKEAISLFQDAQGNLKVKEKKGLRTIIRDANEDDLSLIKRLSENLR